MIPAKLKRLEARWDDWSWNVFHALDHAVERLVRPSVYAGGPCSYKSCPARYQ